MVNPGQPIGRVQMLMPGFILVDPDIGGMVARQLRPKRGIAPRIVPADGIFQLDHFRQHQSVITAAFQRLFGRAIGGGKVHLVKAGNRFVWFPMGAQAGTPAKLTVIERARVACGLGQLHDECRNIGADQAVPQVIFAHGRGRCRQGRVVMCKPRAAIQRRWRARSIPCPCRNGANQSGQWEKSV